MTRGHWTQALLMLALGVAGSGQTARAAEFRCWNGDLERRVELNGPDAASGTACEVRYWRNAKAPGNGRVLWQAQRDADFCAARAHELIARLKAGGWTCDAGEQPGSAEPTQAARADPAPAPDVAADAPAQIAPALLPQAPAADDPLQPSSPAAAQSKPSAPGEATVPPTATSKAALLAEIVEETLQSVQELYGGRFQADPAAFGELDGDGLEDAAVLVTYQADREDYVQYLVAYRFNGETFQSVATKNVGGRFLDALRANLEGIADRRILVELETLDGRATCCTTRRSAFALEQGQLVEVADPGAPEVERTSQAERSSPG